MKSWTRIVSVTLAMCLAGVATGLGQVRYQRLLHAEDEPDAWLMYSGNYRSHRFSPLTGINTDNVTQLTPIWMYQTQAGSSVQTSPLVADGVMYLSGPPSTAAAVDLKTGRSLWTWSRPMPKDVRALGFPKVNRGLAILDDTLFIGTLDAHLTALDRGSGNVRWDVVLADNELGYAITAAPLAIDGKIIVGVSGGEAGVRGFLDAYDPETGTRLWRFHTVPGPGEPGHDSWAGESWKTGGAATWLTGSFDPELNLLYWGTGNPAPDWNGDSRPGDNLYSCSVIALNADTGALIWHFQFTPHDTHDWDANQIPVLVDAQWDGRPRKLVIFANRNAFYYVLDRETGEFLMATAYAKQTWAEKIDENGRPVVLPNTEPTEEGNLVYPSLQGATNWFSPSLDLSQSLLYVAVREMGSHYFKSEVDYDPGSYFLGGGERALSGDQSSGAIRALDITTGQTRWNFQQHSPPWAGVMATAGGLVFAGTNEGNFFALDSSNGSPLWQFQTGGTIRSNPISYSYRDKQHIAISAGNTVIVFGLPN